MKKLSELFHSKQSPDFRDRVFKNVESELSANAENSRREKLRQNLQWIGLGFATTLAAYFVTDRIGIFKSEETNADLSFLIGLSEDETRQSDNLLVDFELLEDLELLEELKPTDLEDV